MLSHFSLRGVVALPACYPYLALSNGYNFKRFRVGFYLCVDGITRVYNPYDIVLKYERITINKRISIIIYAVAIVSSINYVMF